MYVHVTAWLWTWRLTFFLLSLIFLAWFSFIDLYIKFSAEKLSFAPSWLYLRLLAECLQHVLLFFCFFFFEMRENTTRVLTKKTIKQRKGILRQLQDLWQINLRHCFYFHFTFITAIQNKKRAFLLDTQAGDPKKTWCRLARRSPCPLTFRGAFRLSYFVRMN